jgi:hypothetical protein
MLLMRILAWFTPRHLFPILGHVEVFPNRGRDWKENFAYFRIPVVCGSRRVFLLLTAADYQRALQRSERNAEDCPFPRSRVARCLWPIIPRPIRRPTTLVVPSLKSL